MREADGERGSGAVLAVAIVAACVVVGLSGVGLAAALTVRERIAGTAGLAALAAADAASGAVAGDPCSIAGEVSRGGGARLTGCHVDGLVVDVTVDGAFRGIPIEASARAGPP